MHSVDDKILRILDANLNRLKEGLRVIEDIMRFVYDDKECSSDIKQLRHKAVLQNEVLKARNVLKDVGKATIASEAKRESIDSILHANFHRVFESARVLEEILKLESCAKYGDSDTFKSIRYEAYNLHKIIIYDKIMTLGVK